MERVEALVISLDQEILDEIRMQVETEDLVEALFGEEAARDAEDS